MLKTSSEKTSSSGSIIGTASVAGIRSNAGATAYSASKAAVVSIAQTCAYQLAGTNIRVNAICPGLIETGSMSFHHFFLPFLDSLGRSHALPMYWSCNTLAMLKTTPFFFFVRE
jgi:NAD(P)-dependent dehydrogenase (short-subunit alcohol dehydrogenase family)